MTTIVAPPGIITMSFGVLKDCTVEGPWDGEPDKAQWVDAETDLDCMMLRNRMGAWCGYVGVPFEHKLHGADYDDVNVDVHGGLTFASLCDEGHGEDAICHVPAPGRPADVWWFGFDCGHWMDVMPLMVEMEKDIPIFKAIAEDSQWRSVYRDFDYVVTEVTQLALQLAVLR